MWYSVHLKSGRYGTSSVLHPRHIQAPELINARHPLLYDILRRLSLPSVQPRRISIRRKYICNTGATTAACVDAGANESKSAVQGAILVRQHATRRVSRTSSKPRTPFDTADGAVVVAKTGMGSSAALVSSLVGAILSFFGAARLPCFDDSQNQTPSLEENVPGVEESLDLTHNLAQACHCVAQGKVFRSMESFKSTARVLSC